MPARNPIYYSKQLYEALAKSIHGNKYDYSLSIPDGSTKKIEVICNTCGNHFMVKAWDHLYGGRNKMGMECPICANKSRSKSLTKDTNWFMQQLNIRRKDKGGYYDYSKVVYIKSTDDIEIICPIHGPFRQSAWSHLNGSGCPICGQDRVADAHRYTWDEYFEIMKSKRYDKCGYYDYSNAKYVDTNTEIEIGCPKHGPFHQLPSIHANNGGCPHCRSSKLESATRGILEKYNIKFEYEMRFEWLGSQSIDFYLPDYNIGIECQGIQHYKEVPYFKNYTLEQRKQLDARKRMKCKYYGINIHYIRYDEKDIEARIKKILNKYQ